MLFHQFHNSDAYFIKQIKWDGDEYQRHQVGWGDDSSH